MRAWILGALFLHATVVMAQDEGPSLNKRFPIDHHLSPPSVGVVEACSQHVYVSGFVPHATIRVYRNGALVAMAKPRVGFAALAVPPLFVNDQLTATQTVQNVTSQHTNPATIVGHSPTSIAAPVVDPVIYACGHVVPVHSLISGVTVDVRDLDANASIGTGYTPNDWGSDWSPVVTSALVGGHHIAATQMSCSPNVSPQSTAVVVLPEPNPLLTPAVDTPIVGNDAVMLHGLYTGAAISIFDHGNPDGAGYATGSDNWQSLDTRVTTVTRIAATQSLCHHSQPSDTVPPIHTLPAPVVLGPICPKDVSAKIRGNRQARQEHRIDQRERGGRGTDTDR